MCFLYTMSFVSRLLIFLLEVQNNDSTAFLIGEKAVTIITENLGYKIMHDITEDVGGLDTVR